MSQNKKKFFGKHKDEQEQDLEQTQPLPSISENTADKTVQTEENTHRKKHPKKLMLTKKARRQSSLPNPFAKDLIEASAFALSLQPD